MVETPEKEGNPGPFERYVFYVADKTRNVKSLMKMVYDIYIRKITGKVIPNGIDKIPPHLILTLQFQERLSMSLSQSQSNV